MPEPTHETRPLREDERGWLSGVLQERRGGELIVGRGSCLSCRHWSPSNGEERVGVSMYVVKDGLAELDTLDTLREGASVGQRLIEAASASASGCRSCAPTPRRGAADRAFDLAGRKTGSRSTTNSTSSNPLEPLRPLDT
jgi:hypothetical protein